MNRLALGNQRTGQPRCEQLIAKAMNSFSLNPPQPGRRLGGDTRPRQAARNPSSVTFTVAPISKSSTLPTRSPEVRHFARNGASNKSHRREWQATAPPSDASANAQAAQKTAARQVFRRNRLGRCGRLRVSVFCCCVFMAECSCSNPADRSDTAKYRKADQHDDK